jgi:hypothetical protein
VYLYVSSNNEKKLKTFDPIENLCSGAAKVSLLTKLAQIGTNLFICKRKKLLNVPAFVSTFSKEGITMCYGNTLMAELKW